MRPPHVPEPGVARSTTDHATRPVPSTRQSQGPPEQARLLDLQRTAGNRAVQGIVGGPPPATGARVVQRALLDSRADWVRGSNLKWKTRSRALHGIDRAVGVYARAGTDELRVDALVAILDAIVAWRRDKGADEETNIGGRADTAGRSPFVQALMLEVRTEVERILDTKRAFWGPVGGDLNDPSLHDPANYTYLVNSVVDYGAEGNVVPWHINALLHDPSTIQNALISSSVITDTRNPTWAVSGFILRAPRENIYGASSRDVALKNTATTWSQPALYKELMRVFQANGLPTPTAVMQGMKTDYTQKVNEQTEVAVMGTHPVTGAKTTISAIFVVTAPGTSDPKKPIPLFQTLQTVVQDERPRYIVQEVPGVSPGRMVLYEQMSTEHGIPMVAIPLGAQTAFRAQPNRPTPWSAAMIRKADWDEMQIQKQTGPVALGGDGLI